MKPETSVINIFGKHNIYVEHYRKHEFAKTIILVNGAFATTTSFSQTIRYLRDKVNVLLFDLPYAGRSKEFNEGGIVTKEDEVNILEYLIDHFRVNYLMSVSWGGVSSLLSLARRPATIEKAIIASFSPVINQPMREYMAGARDFLSSGDTSNAAQLLNDTVGRHLSSLVKSHNFNYLVSSVKGNEDQLIFHINQIFEFDQQQYMQHFSSIDVPVLFINGELDEYTTASDARLLERYIPQSEFAVVENAGHFLDLESRQLWKTVSGVIREYFFEEERPYVNVPCSLKSVIHRNLAFVEAGE